MPKILRAWCEALRAVEIVLEVLEMLAETTVDIRKA
jgi:hypothetical protein